MGQPNNSPDAVQKIERLKDKIDRILAWGCEGSAVQICPSRPTSILPLKE
jgi:hypothetical protein